MEFNLTFIEALQVVFAGGKVRGNNFGDGVYIRQDYHGSVIVESVFEEIGFTQRSDFMLTKGVTTQKYRVVESVKYLDLLD